MPLIIGLDDTDSLAGGCTTFVATEIVRALRDVDLIGYPRLVRLNPNVPWKTRGNGALCMRVGHGRGRRFPVGRYDGTQVFAHEQGGAVPPSEDLMKRLRRVVERWSWLEEEDTNPAIVVAEKRPPASLYWNAVRDLVHPSAAWDVLDGALVETYKNGRGVIGAASAAAWRPSDRTYELIAYRRRERWGTRRHVDEASVIAMDRAFPTTFHNYDYEHRRVVFTPRSPCPILYGIRGDDPDVLPHAMSRVRSEAIERWMLFETNQGTDEHLQRASAAEVRPYTSVVVRGKVADSPRTLPGGHVVVRIEDATGAIDCTAYEPSKGFRRVVRALAPGDVVTAFGGVRGEPLTINLEKLRVRSLARAVRKVANPACKRCGKRMKSEGRRGGFRCLRCGTKAARRAAVYEEVPRTLRPGFYEPPVCARRHLSMPLRRLRVPAPPAPPAGP